MVMLFDIGVCIIVVYDGQVGGVGFVEVGFEKVEEWWYVIIMCLV